MEKRAASGAPKLTTVYCLLFLLAGCATVPLVSEREAARALEKAKRLYSEGDFQGAKVAFSTFRSGQTQPVRKAEGYYWEGMCLLAQREFTAAREKFESGLENRPEGWLRGYMLCGHGGSLMGLREFAAAREAYEKALEVSPEDIRLDYVLLRIATCAQRLLQWEEADVYLNRLLAEVPGSALTDQAREKLQYGKKRFFTVQVEAFKDIASALKRAAEFKKLELDAFVGEIERGGEQLHCVWIGRFESWEEANLAMQRIRGQVGVENAIVKP